ncbi:MAG: alkane 1-monooxygenase [Pseudomonadota bacterium]
MAVLEDGSRAIRTDFIAALPFWLALTYVPALIGSVWLAVNYSGWWLALVPVYGWYVMSILDFIGGLETSNPDVDTPDEKLRWYTAITVIWPFVQLPLIFGTLIFVSNWDLLSLRQEWVLMAVVGIPTGTIGINFAHELMHQRSKFERILGDVLMTSVLYGHFRSEHLLVHHRYVGTPRDPVSARYNEGFHRFFPRVVYQCFVSAWAAEKTMLRRKNLPWWDWSNPFWRYGLWQLGFLALAGLIGGWMGVGMFMLQAFVAFFQLELVNYVEHYGLTREHKGNGKYEYVKPRHSWNAAHKISNYFLINLQRHSDHHFKPMRRFPLLQTYDEEEAPQLPFGYPIMTLMAVFPPLFKYVMNPKVRQWRQQYYPHIEDWHPYNKCLNQMPG